MNFRTPGLFGLACALLLGSATGLAKEELSLSNKWRIECSESAKSDGTLLFRVTPQDGTSIDVPVTISKGRSENHVAQDIRDALQKTLDAEAFHAEIDDGEDVLVKKKRGPDFALVLVESSVEAVRIRVQKE